MGLGLKISAALLLVILVLLGGFYWYFKYSQDKIDILTANVAKLESAVRLNEETIKAMKAKSEEQAQQVVELQQGLNEANTARKDLEAKFRKYDLNALARTDSKALELRMNRATEKVWKDLETLTGKPQPPASAPSTKPQAVTPPAINANPYKTKEQINAQ